jgi:drug/metabolite transporter (DMT)-like permease
LKKYIPYIQLHIAVLLFGITGILGRLINEEGISGPLLVVDRLAITLLSLVIIFPQKIRAVVAYPKKDLLQIAGIGLIVCAHWVTFYTSIQLSNVSIALCALAATPFFTSLIEPIVFKKAIHLQELLLGSLVIIGFVFVFGGAGQHLLGLLVGIASSLFAALFSVLNKKIVDDYDTFQIMFIEFGAGLVLLLLGFPLILQVFPTEHIFPQNIYAWTYLIALSLFCTTLAFALSMFALKHISTFTSNLTICLEPIYGFVFAYFYFHEGEQLNAYFYLGAGIILFSVFLHPLLQQVEKRRLS